ncbi:hypothetical protein C8R43DRAFT_868755 [Mycena crocata]|nr:hypothetical protein C8R43DRAFT_868755 [Mycena crocata]
MFKSAATKIAHNSTLPALALSGNKDLRPLQDLITAEKAVLISLQKLSVDFSKASEALRIWGAGEGDDLGDILGASTTILAHFSAALSGYASREHAIRDHLKAIRTREEALDELKRRRKAALARADSAEKKLNKMGPEHKNLASQTDVLNQLQAQIRSMDSEIMTEEAALGDFKRSSARSLMGLKFGGLMELSEKGCVVAEVGRGVVAEISEEQTQPGLSRAMYMAHQRTEQRVMEADRCVNEIVFSALPPSSPSGAPPRINTTFGAGGGDAGSIDMGSTGMGIGSINTGLSSMNMNNTGVSAVSMHNTGSQSGFSQAGSEVPPSTGLGGRKETSGSDFMSAVLDAGEFGSSQGGSSQSQFEPAHYTMYPQPQPGSQFAAKQQERERDQERERQRQSHEEEPAPEYRDYEPTSHSQVYDYPGVGGTMPAGPPPGAAAPVVGGVWIDNGPGPGMREPSGLAVEEGGADRKSAASEDVGLAYMNLGPSEPEEREARMSKHVRFGDEGGYAEPEPSHMRREDSSSGNRSRRVPPPSVEPVQDERALNAAAAREVSRELDALNFSAPAPAQPQAQAPPPAHTHHSTPSWDAPAPVQPAPFSPGHHTTPSWAITPASTAEGGSPSSPRLETPYRAPVANRSTSSLNTQPPPGARTISAAAFRRPQKTASSSDLADTSPLSFKKRLPASPYPQQRAGSGLREASPQPPQQPPPQQQHDDDFDYISAYGRDSQAFLEDGSPMQADFDYGRLGKVGVVGGTPTSPGYSQGRFATDLDADGVR